MCVCVAGAPDPTDQSSEAPLNDDDAQGVRTSEGCSRRSEASTYSGDRLGAGQSAYRYGWMDSKCMIQRGYSRWPTVSSETDTGRRTVCDSRGTRERYSPEGPRPEGAWFMSSAAIAQTKQQYNTSHLFPPKNKGSRLKLFWNLQHPRGYRNELTQSTGPRTNDHSATHMR